MSLRLLHPMHSSFALPIAFFSPSALSTSPGWESGGEGEGEGRRGGKRGGVFLSLPTSPFI